MTTTTTNQGLPLLPAYRDVTVELTPRYGQHWYRVTGYDDLLPSVTTVLKIIDRSGPLVGWAKKTALESVRSALHEYAAGPFVKKEVYDLWVAGIIEAAKQSPEKERDEAAEAGTSAHELIAELLHGREPDIPDPLAPAVRGGLAFVRDYQLELVASEVSIWHPQRHYAGTVDLVARNKAGELVVADWKRSKGLYAEHAYQVAGYANAIEAITGEAVVAAYAVRLPRTADEKAEYEARMVADPKVASETCRAALALWLATRDSKKVWAS